MSSLLAFSFFNFAIAASHSSLILLRVRRLALISFSRSDICANCKCLRARLEMLLIRSSPMRILKESVPFDEILACYEQENRGWPGYAIGIDYLNAANARCQGKWTLMSLSKADVSSVMLPYHRHHGFEVIPQSGL